MAVITINGKEFPAPDIGMNLLVATNVSDGKNASRGLVSDAAGICPVCRYCKNPGYGS